MAATYLGLSADAGDAPGRIREALGQLERMGALLINSDIYFREREGEPLLYSCVAELDTDVKLTSLLGALRDDYGLLAARDISALGTPNGKPSGHERVEPTWSVALADLLGIPAPKQTSVNRVAGTARLQRMPDVDYDASQGAGASYDELRPLSTFDIDLFNRVAQSIEHEDSSAAGVGSLSVLDVGCGTGRFTRLLAARGFKTTGVDKSRVMLSAARVAAAAVAAGSVSTAETIRYLRCDANHELPEGRWDALTFFFSAQYMAFDRRFWSKVQAALKPSGTVVFATFAHRHFIETELTRFFPSIPRIDLARFPSIPALRRSLQENGFERVEDCEVEHHTQIPPAELIRRVEGKYLSSLHLLEAAEYEAGLARMRSELRGVALLQRILRSTVVSARVQRKAS